MEPFGKHYQHNVPGLEITYDQDAYDNCSLRAKFSLSSSEARTNQAFNETILEMLVEHASVIRGVISHALGIKVSPRLFETMLKKFIDESRYKCKGVIPSNLPFAMVYWVESQSLMAQYIFDSEMQNAINASKHFGVGDEQVLPKEWCRVVAAAKRESKPVSTKPIWGPHKIAFYLGRRVRRGDERNGEPNSMTLKVTEHTNNKPTGSEVFAKTITYSNRHFFNAIAAFERQLTSPDTAAEAQKKKSELGKMAFTYIAPLLPKDWRPSWETQV